RSCQVQVNSRWEDMAQLESLNHRERRFTTGAGAEYGLAVRVRLRDDPPNLIPSMDPTVAKLKSAISELERARAKSKRIIVGLKREIGENRLQLQLSAAALHNANNALEEQQATETELSIGDADRGGRVVSSPGLEQTRKQIRSLQHAINLNDQAVRECQE